MRNQETGRIGEKTACEFLNNNGYTVIETNYRCRHGEIDIIAKQDNTLVFIEVRTKKSYNYGTPEESITYIKQARLNAVAEHYRQNHANLPPYWRIDVIAIQMERNGKISRLEIVKNAVEDIA